GTGRARSRHSEARTWARRSRQSLRTSTREDQRLRRPRVSIAVAEPSTSGTGGAGGTVQLSRPLASGGRFGGSRPRPSDATSAYPEHVTITKPLKLRGVTSLAPQFVDTTHFDGGCTAGPIVTIASNDVQIRDIGFGSDANGAIDVQGRSHVKLKSLFALSNCPT